MPTTRTLNPLHFEDLEPHRFEDLVRQLVYGFRDWHTIEATGRLGGDAGIDIRATEYANTYTPEETDEEGLSEVPRVPREWWVQCKRESRVGPKRMAAIAADLIREGRPNPHGVLIAAPADFSSATRDEFRLRMVEAGVEEFVLWGKAELEDLLFRPANDHLLFAYFGISLRVRRASRRSAANALLTTKRRLTKALGEIRGHPTAHVVLLRDPEAEEYPWPRDQEVFLQAPPWRYYQFHGFVAPDVLGFVTKQHFAWADFAAGEWDMIPHVDLSWPRYPELEGIDYPDDPKEPNARNFWDVRVPQHNQAMAKEVSLIHYSQIIAVDEIGDPAHEPPHLLVDFEQRPTPFRKAVTIVESTRAYHSETRRIDEMKRTKFFPVPLPHISEDERRTYWDERLKKN